MVFRFFIIIWLFFFSSFVHAGWFGPNNFEECVLEKMKGQDKSLLKLVVNMCEKEFPREKQLGIGYIGHLRYEWTTDMKTISVKIEENNGDYAITKIKAIFAQNKCNGNIEGEDQIKSIVEKDDVGSIGIPLSSLDALAAPAPDIEMVISVSGDRVGSFQVPGERLYRCVRIQELYGKYRK